MNITFKLITLIVCFKISSASLVAVKQQNWSQISFLVLHTAQANSPTIELWHNIDIH